MSEKHKNSRLLLVFFGMTAAGKSFLARTWSERSKCPYYNTDVVRKELAGVAADSGRNEGVGKGIYSREFTRKTYDELLERVGSEFRKAGNDRVVLDGSYGSDEERRKVVDRFSGVARICFIYCWCDEATVQQRLLQRKMDPNAVSDGRWEIYLMQKKAFSVPDRIDGADLLVLDTAGSVETLCAEIDAFVG